MSTRQENGFPHSSSPLAKGGSRGVCITVSPRRRVTRSLSSPSSLRRSVAPSLLPAFSLLEMMIAIVILGIGLIMVATMFPVAWTRARTLSETTVQRSIAAGAQATLAQSLRPASLKTDVSSLTQLVSGSMLGDLFYTPDGLNLPQNKIIRESDTRVHALNAENLKVERQPSDSISDSLIEEDSWAIEALAEGFIFDPDDTYKDFFTNLGAQSPFAAQVPFEQRVYPPLPPAPVQGASDYQALEASWYEQLDGRRFSISILHRLQQRIGPLDPGTQLSAETIAEAKSAMTKPRVFDVYYVTLRRPNPTNRYAMQDPTQVPDPLDPLGTPVAPRPLAAQNDVAFPAPWRVEVEFPPIGPFRSPPAGSAEPGPTGVPTEITVPRADASFDQRTSAMIISTFPEGTRFIDEVSGRVYRVVKRRVAADGLSATLTLDREVFRDDMQNMDPADPQSYYNRTVWVFPPAVDRSVDPPNFDGPSPVVSIEVRTMTLSPSN